MAGNVMEKGTSMLFFFDVRNSRFNNKVRGTFLTDVTLLSIFMCIEKTMILFLQCCEYAFNIKF